MEKIGIDENVVVFLIANLLNQTAKTNTGRVALGKQLLEELRVSGHFSEEVVHTLVMHAIIWGNVSLARDLAHAFRKNRALSEEEQGIATARGLDRSRSDITESFKRRMKKMRHD